MANPVPQSELPRRYIVHAYTLSSSHNRRGPGLANVAPSFRVGDGWRVDKLFARESAILFPSSMASTSYFDTSDIWNNASWEDRESEGSLDGFIAGCAETEHARTR